jgi:hypothetical protein
LKNIKKVYRTFKILEESKLSNKDKVKIDKWTRWEKTLRQHKKKKINCMQNTKNKRITMKSLEIRMSEVQGDREKAEEKK